jgi:hypothetical protein
MRAQGLIPRIFHYKFFDDSVYLNQVLHNYYIM